MNKTVSSYLPGAHPWQNNILLFETLPSTNDHAKVLAQQGAPEGTVVIAKSQSAGRGRIGRSFHAPADLGLYLSLILRPACTPDKLMHLTCAVAKACCDGIQNCTGIRPHIKWINDLILQNRKLGGILTELSVNSKTGLVDWAVVGIGINCLHTAESFPQDLQHIATSLYAATGKHISPALLGAAVIDALYQMNQQLLTEKEMLLQAYRQDCLTLGKEIYLLQGDSKTPVFALDIDDQGGLLVRFPDGTTSCVCSGEISVRGICGYL